MFSILLSLLIVSVGARSPYIGKNVKQLSDSDTMVGCITCHPIVEGKINVHLIPHSHDDVGWLKTVDQYFYGLKTDIQRAAVVNIITSVVEALIENSERKFVQVETAFFWKWWSIQNDDMRNKFKYLVDNGQIEMLNGAWSMNDEACVNYQSTIDQFTWGLRTINDTLGACGLPRVGWQIDPFGHSREQASIFSQLGFDGVFFSRLDYADREKRSAEHNMDFAWQGSANLDDSIIFGGIFPDGGYAAPRGFCWDYTCNDAPIYDDPESPLYNVDSIVEGFVDIIKTYSKFYPTNNILIPMGEDFYYEVAQKNYINMDKLIKALQDNTEVTAFYSTPSCYIKAVNDAEPELRLKTDDFFPYSDKAHSFWTGYFTSRSNSKRFERIGHNILQATKQLVALNGFKGSSYEEKVNSLEKLRSVMGIMQHHDAVTGTEKQHVTNDYVRLLTRAIKEAEEPIGNIIGELLSVSDNDTLDLNFSSCLLSNISICSVTQNSESFLVAAYNPLSWTVTHIIRLPVEDATYEIQGPDGQEKYNIIDTIPYFETDKSNESSNSELIFTAKDIPSMGIKLYYISKTSKTLENPSSSSVHSISVADDFFGDEDTGFYIDTETNLLRMIVMNGVYINITQNFYYYKSETGESDGTNVSSGAYIFRPLESYAQPLSGNIINTSIVRTEYVDEFHQKWSDDNVNVAQIIRVHKNQSQSYIEFDWLIGGINIDDNVGKEVVVRYTVDDFQNDETFYTDSNGREMIERVLNFRPDYTYNTTSEPVSGNYYPVTSRIVIKDKKKDVELGILTDRSQGGTSLENGQIELMVHRRILHDDHKGVGENLNETEFGNGVYVRGSHYLIVGSAKNTNAKGKTTAAEQRILAQKKLVQPWIGVASADSEELSLENVQSKLKFSYSALSKDLPENINILTYEPWKDDQYLLRFEYILEKDDDSSLSNATTIDIQDLFNVFTIDEMNETTLGANEWLENYKQRSKYTWNTVGSKMEVISSVEDASEQKITLTPMQIRTFIVKVSQHSDALSNKAGSIFVFLILLLHVVY